MSASGPLAGIKIIEIGQMIAVPAATYLLATQGAEVLKVEDTEHGDELRHYGSQKGGLSAWFINANTGKRSLGVDLRAAEGKTILWQLLETADAMIQGFRPGALERLGFGHTAVLKRFPSLVYCSSSGFGSAGPYANLPVYDPIIQALSGWAGAQQTGAGPSVVRGMVADKTAALTSAQALTAALLQRERTGVGTHLELSMLEANISFNWPDVMMDASLLDADADHRPNVLAAYRLFQCRDGWVTVTTGTDSQWQGFCEALDRNALAADPRFNTASGRGANVGAWYEAMEEAVGAFRQDDVLRLLHAADVPVAPVLDPGDIASDAQVKAAQLIREVQHPTAGRLLQPRPSGEVFGASLQLGAAPRHGEHTTEILTELGYDGPTIATLESSGTVKRCDPDPSSRGL
jgi:crotonobetainyl-CoA:carnitine CoA-transferase CaiB-like acyl-CoA transferase